MSFKIKTINDKELVCFLINPFLKAAQFGDFIFQKYPKEDESDEIFAIYKKSSCYYNIGFVNYKAKKVFVQEDYPLSSLDISVDPFVIINDKREALKKSVKEMVEKAKQDRITEIEERSVYDKFYYFYKSRLLKEIVFSLLGTNTYDTFYKSSTECDIETFCENLSVQDVINITTGDLYKINRFIEQTIFSKMFIVTDVIFKKLEVEAADYVKSGIFTEREQQLMKYIEHTKPSGAKRFTAYFAGGKKLRCRNKITAEGLVTVIRSSEYKVDFEEIEKIEYNGKTIYTK